jgi:hypothetical protein
MLLAAALIVGQIMVRRKVSVIGDSAVALLLGLVAGVFFFYLDLSATYLAWCALLQAITSLVGPLHDTTSHCQCPDVCRIGFSRDFFFTALLPPM